MFNWICPQCGSEVLASYSECPECAKRGTQPAAAAQTMPQAQTVAQVPAGPVAPAPTRIESPYSPMFAAPPAVQQPAAPVPTAFQQPYYPQPPQYYPPPPYAAPPRAGLPTWLMSILFALGFVAFGAGVYWLINHNREDATPTASASGVPAASPASAAPAKSNPMQKYVEVTGVRLFQDSKKRVEAKFLVVNHSDAEVQDLEGTVEIRARTAKEGDAPVGTFRFRIGSMGPNDAKEATAPVETKLKVYELPDWQLIDTRVQLASR